MSSTEGILWVCGWCRQELSFFAPANPHVCPAGHEHPLCIRCYAELGAEPPDIPGMKLPGCPDDDSFRTAFAIMGGA